MNTQNCSSEPWFIQVNELAQRLHGWRWWLPSMLPLFIITFYIEVEGIKIPATLDPYVGCALHKKAWTGGWNLACTQGIHLAPTWKKGTYHRSKALIESAGVGVGGWGGEWLLAISKVTFECNKSRSRNVLSKSSFRKRVVRGIVRELEVKRLYVWFSMQSCWALPLSP